MKILHVYQYARLTNAGFQCARRLKDFLRNDEVHTYIETGELLDWCHYEPQWKDYDLILTRAPSSKRGKYWNYWSEQLANRGDAKIALMHTDAVNVSKPGFADWDFVVSMTPNFHLMRPTAPVDDSVPWVYLPYTGTMPKDMKQDIAPGSWDDFEYDCGYIGIHKEYRARVLEKLWADMKCATGGTIRVPNADVAFPSHVPVAKMLQWYKTKCASNIYVTCYEQTDAYCFRLLEGLSTSVGFVHVEANPSMSWLKHKELYVKNNNNFLGKFTVPREHYVELLKDEWEYQKEQSDIRQAVYCNNLLMAMEAVVK